MILSRVLVAVLVCSVACGDNLDADEPIEIPELLAATIGSAGGELVGPADTAWEGVRLKVPAGALASATMITIEPIVDPVPLAGDAERIGPQFKLGPASVALTMQVELTLPFDHDLRDVFDVLDSESRVWFRSGDGWSNAPQIASTPDTVTVKLDRFTTVAAGAFVTAQVVSCTGCRAPECLVGTDFCLEVLPAPTAPVFHFPSLVIKDRVVYYVTSPATNSFTVARYDLTTTPIAQTKYLAHTGTPNASVAVRGSIAVEADGSAWVGIGGYGNVRFRANALASRFETSGVIPFGVVIDPLKNLPARLSGLTFTPFRPPNTPPRTRIQSIRSTIGTGNPATILSTQPNETFFAVPRRGIPLLDPATSGHVRYFAFRTRRETFGTFSPGTSPQTVSPTYVPNSVLAVSETADLAVAGGSGPNAGMVRTNLAGNTVTIALPSEPFSMTFDDQGNLYVVDGSRAQIQILARDGGISTLVLTTAALGTDEYNQRLPRAIRYIRETDSLLLITRGPSAGPNKFFQLTNLPD